MDEVSKYMIKRIAESIELSFDIPDAEKEVATHAIMLFEATLKALDEAVEHLDILYHPFKKYDSISTESIVERRGVLNRFKQTSIKKFNEFKQKAFYAIKKLDFFSNGDKTIQELVLSFETSISELEEEVENFLDALSDYTSPDYRNNIINYIDNIKASYEALSDLIVDRIIEHIDTEILAKRWLTNTRDELNVEDDSRIPLIMELFEERQRMLNGEMPNSVKEEQLLNSGNQQKMHYPDNYKTELTQEVTNVLQKG